MLTLSHTDRTFDGLVELTLCEQLRETMPTELRTFTAEQGATTLTDLITLADRYTTAHDEANTRRKVHDRQNQGSNPSSANESHNQNHGQEGKGPKGILNHPNRNNAPHKLYCTHCKTQSHNTADCKRLARLRPHTIATYQQVPTSTECVATSKVTHTNPVSEHVLVNSKPAKCLYDTGLSYDAVVRHSLVDPTAFTGETVTLQAPDLTLPPITLPVAKITVESRYVKGKLKAAVMDNPVYDLILGCKYVFLGSPPYPEHVAAVQTKAQAKQDPPPKQEVKQTQLTDHTLAKGYKELSTAHNTPHTGGNVKGKRQGPVTVRNLHMTAPVVSPQLRRRRRRKRKRSKHAPQSVANFTLQKNSNQSLSDSEEMFPVRSTAPSAWKSRQSRVEHSPISNQTTPIVYHVSLMVAKTASHPLSTG